MFGKRRLKYDDLSSDTSSLQTELLKREILVADKAMKPGLLVTLGTAFPLVTAIITSSYAATQHLAKTEAVEKRVAAEGEREFAIKEKNEAKASEERVMLKAVDLSQELGNARRISDEKDVQLEKSTVAIADLSKSLEEVQEQARVALAGSKSDAARKKWQNISGRIEMVSTKTDAVHQNFTNFKVDERLVNPVRFDARENFDDAIKRVEREARFGPQQ